MMSATLKATAAKSKTAAGRTKAAETEAEKRRRLVAMLDELSMETKALLARATETSIRLTKKFG